MILDRWSSHHPVRALAGAGALTLLVLASAALAGPRPAGAQAGSGFAGATVFSANGQAATVFFGGTVDRLEAAARAEGAEGVWVQDSGGRFALLIVGGPAFLGDAFRASFPGGFPGAVAVTLTRPPGPRPAVTPTAQLPPPIQTSPPGAAAASPPPAATAAAPRPVPTGIPGPAGLD